MRCTLPPKTQLTSQNSVFTLFLISGVQWALFPLLNTGLVDFESLSGSEVRELTLYQVKEELSMPPVARRLWPGPSHCDTIGRIQPRAIVKSGSQLSAGACRGHVRDRNHLALRLLFADIPYQVYLCLPNRAFLAYVATLLFNRGFTLIATQSHARSGASNVYEEQSL